MHYLNKKKRNNKTKIIIGCIIACLLVGGGIFAYASQPNSSLTTQDGNKASLAPATEEERQAVEDNKKAIVDRQETEKNNPQNASSLKQVTPVITSADATSARGYVNGVFEEGGTCTATAKSGATTYTQTSTGFENVSNTQCAPLNWNTPLATGTWEITLAYSSATASGSTTKTIEVK